jgi:Ca2+/Na+ antiporter
LQTFNHIFELVYFNNYLGLTILAIGNALPDALTTIALAKQGYALMGLTGTYAGYLEYNFKIIIWSPYWIRALNV